MTGKRGDFWSKVGISSPDKCWLWLAANSGSGSDTRGIAIFGGKRWRAHRLAWRLKHGVIPDGLCVCHHCDVPLCCNPSHLFLGTKADNAHDRISKGRPGAKGWSGEQSPSAILTQSSVDEIRELLIAGALWNYEIANRFGVSESLISRIKHDRAWSTIKKAKVFA